MNNQSVFDVLRLGARFDKSKFKKDIEIFEKTLEYTKKLSEHGTLATAAWATCIASYVGQCIDAGETEREQNGHKSTQKESHINEVEGDDVQTKDPFERANVLRKRNKIRVSGSAPPVPMMTFSELESLFNVKNRLILNLNAAGFDEPTAVQKQAISALAQGRELMVVAPTGSGKTLAFLIPLITRVMKQKIDNPDRSGIRALVLSPTKELSMQTGRVLVPLLPGLKLRCSVLSKATAAGTDFSKVDILLANPLRLESMTRDGKIDLGHVETVILDEADKLFEMGFSEQIDGCLAACTNSKVIHSLFSATLPESVENLARSLLKDPLRITVGERNASATSVEQKLMFVGRENGKILAIRQLIASGLRPPVLIFVNTKDKAKEVHKELMFEGVHVDSLHAAQSHASRVNAVEKFRAGKTWVLIATDLVARGLDFAGVETVINLDFPNSTIDYIHRVGRTGRAGRTGKAITFFTEEDVDNLRGVANVINAAGGEVEPWMLQLKKVRNRKRNRLEETAQQEDLQITQNASTRKKGERTESEATKDREIVKKKKKERKSKTRSLDA